MSPWASGDTLDSATLNARGASASSVDGFSTNTLAAQSGQTLNITSPRLVIGIGSQVAGANGIVSITSSSTGKDGVVIVPTLGAANGALGLYCSPTFSGAGDANGTGSAAFGATDVTGTVPIWKSVTISEPTTVTGSLTTNIGMLVSDIVSGTNNFAVHTGRGPIRLGDTSRFTDGTAVAPSLAMDSEISLGFYRSAASTLNQSYGTFVAPDLWASSVLSVNASGSAFKVDSSGVTLVAGSATNAVLFGTSKQSGKGTGMLHIGNCGTSPSVNPTGGGLLFARGGALLWLGTSGSLTTIALP